MLAGTDFTQFAIVVGTFWAVRAFYGLTGKIFLGVSGSMHLQTCFEKSTENLRKSTVWRI